MENWSTWRLLLNEHPTLWSKKHWFAKAHCKPKSTCFFFFTNPCVEKCPFTTISMPPWRIPHQFSIKQQCLPPRSKKKDGAVGLKKRVWLWGRWDHQVDTIWWQMRCPLHPTQWKGTFGITRLWSMFHWESLDAGLQQVDGIEVGQKLASIKISRLKKKGNFKSHNHLSISVDELNTML